MTENSHPERLPSLPLVRGHVARQFGRRGDLEAAQFLYGEVGSRMAERLGYIRLAPGAMLDAGCGAGAALPLLQARYPAASYTGLDLSAGVLEHARRRHLPSMGGRLRHSALKLAGRSPAALPAFVEADMARTGLAPESQDLVWSNMALHWHPEPHAVLAEWRRITRVGGLVMFSCLGPGTFRQLRDAVARAGLETATPPFVDMHDFGDLLVENGFADPVMDQEVLTFTYENPLRLLRDVRDLGGNPAVGRRRGLATPAWRRRLAEALDAGRDDDGLLRLSVEVAYGHAWRAGSFQAAPGETRVAVAAIGRKRSR
ncbi:Malonyl-[acyl-carrier protein] O-methyltransferase [Pigmentiphaga humi]|uniref:Malonyl-[acyl-carrier protein] O-methyltransferase n=1 Tax=Pigmentiphaga humi TaxID=2478468 RepID=A0A3P4B5V9_9BURK|nr:methyltransferase domain-containing protein [Pigmentiphaga humi]VCU70545.1 Malonyl-[acyl-carrier protein] O-methyltransferase [Pigmentiphaga humi]